MSAAAEIAVIKERLDALERQLEDLRACLNAVADWLADVAAGVGS